MTVVLMKIEAVKAELNGQKVVRATVTRRCWWWPKRTKVTSYLCLGVGPFSAHWVREDTGEHVSCLDDLYHLLNQAGVRWQLAGEP